LLWWLGKCLSQGISWKFNLSNESDKMYLYWIQYYSARSLHTTNVCISLLHLHWMKRCCMCTKVFKWKEKFCYVWIRISVMNDDHVWKIPVDDLILYMFCLESTIWMNISLRKVWSKWELQVIEIDWHVYFWNVMK